MHFLFSKFISRASIGGNKINFICEIWQNSEYFCIIIERNLLNIIWQINSNNFNLILNAKGKKNKNSCIRIFKLFTDLGTFKVFWQTF